MSNKTKEYITKVIEEIRSLDPEQKEFLQSIEEVFRSVSLSLDKNPQYMENRILERMSEPERQIMFRVSWVDDAGKIHINRGYSVLFNGVLGPFKGGLRFHPTVNLSVIKFLGFEQTYKNALTGLPIGGGKGGTNFDPRGKSEAEIRRFCAAFMTELYHYIGSDVGVPAGDIGVGGREIGFLFGTFSRISGTFDNGTITGKGASYGGSNFRPEATGTGIAYFTNEIMKHHKDTLKGKRIVVSGYGQVAWGTIKKVAELGGIPLTISGSGGFVHDPEGIITKEKISYIDGIKKISGHSLEDYAERFGAAFYPGEKPWRISADVAIPCATQNEIGLEEAALIAGNGTKYVVEGANMPCTNDAIKYFQGKGMVVGPAKAANAGGVSVSVMEMSQNAIKLMLSDKHMDERLKEIMEHMHQDIFDTCEEYDLGYDLITGANITAFERVADTMIRLGTY